MFKIILQIIPLLITTAFVPIQAATLSFTPTAQFIDAGNTAFVDIVISDLGSDIVTAYDLSVSFDSTVLSFSSIGINLTPFGVAFSDSGSPVAGVLDFDLVSFESDADLNILQSDSILLATLGFDTLSVGISTLDFSFINIAGANFTDLIPTVQNGVITVNSTAVSEPTALMLLTIGAIGFLTANRKNKVYFRMS